MGLEYFPFYHSYRKKCEKLTDQELGRLVRALLLYSETGETQELAGRESIAFDFISVDIENAHAAYNEKCAKNRANRTGDNDRERPSTDDDERAQNKTKTKVKENKNQNQSITTPPAPPPLGEVMDFFMNNINAMPSPDVCDQLRQYTETLSAPVVIHAMQITQNERKGWSYLKAILGRYEREGLTSEEAVKASEQAREQAKGQKPGGRQMMTAAAYAARDIQPIDMEKLRTVIDRI